MLPYLDGSKWDWREKNSGIKKTGELGVTNKLEKAYLRLESAWQHYGGGAELGFFFFL